MSGIVIYDVKYKIPKIDENSKLMKNIQSIFGIEEVLSEINVSFDQPLLSDGYGIDETDIFAKVNSIFWKRNFN